MKNITLRFLRRKIARLTLTLPVLASLLLTACMEDTPHSDLLLGLDQPTTVLQTPTPIITPLPTREAFEPGQLVDYEAQPGDTLPALAVRFNTSEAEIRTANPTIPEQVTTLPPGMPMKIPIYYLPLWGSPYQIIPDDLFVNGPEQDGFNTAAFIQSQPGWLRGYVGAAGKENKTASELINRVALDYSVSPRLLLALLEYQSSALSKTSMPANAADYALGYTQPSHRGLYMQLIWAANTLNNAFYQYLDGKLTMIEHLGGTEERPDPWQNAASVAIQDYFSGLMDGDAYTLAISGAGLARTYTNLFGDPWQQQPDLIPGSLQQPELSLPFQPGKTWAFTGGPHTGWGDGAPLAAIDFAPPSVAAGCLPSDEWATAVAPGVIVRSEDGLVVLDLDGDGDERTGWTILYLHTIHDDSISVGKKVNTGDIIGHPSCEAGRATGTHLHIARKYNGEWILAGSGVLPFDFEGWVTHAGAEAYQGTMTRNGQTLTACTCSDSKTFIRRGK